MRVLWLTQSQLPAATGQSSMIFGGWHEGLRSALEEFEPELELGIVSLGAVRHEPLQVANASYFSLPMPQGGGRARRAARAWWSNTVVPRAVVSEAAAAGRGFRPDIVHVHGTEHFLGLAALQMPYPAVATLQGIASVYERFVLDGFSCPEVARSVFTRDFIRGTSLVHGHVQMRHRAQVEARIVDGLSFFMGQTDWDRDVLKLLNPAATYFHTECIMQRDFYEHTWRQQDRPLKTVYCTSGAAPYKGLEMLIEALALLRRGGYTNVGLRVAGPIPDSMMWSPLARLAARRGVGDHIAWLGPQPASGLVRELLDTDLVRPPVPHRESAELAARGHAARRAVRRRRRRGGGGTRRPRRQRARLPRQRRVRPRRGDRPAPGRSGERPFDGGGRAAGGAVAVRPRGCRPSHRRRLSRGARGDARRIREGAARGGRLTRERRARKGAVALGGHSSPGRSPFFSMKSARVRAMRRFA